MSVETLDTGRRRRLPSPSKKANKSFDTINIANLKTITGIKAITSEQKTIILDRLKNEVIRKFHFRHDRNQHRLCTPDEVASQHKIQRAIVRDRFLFGINQVTRALEEDLVTRSSTSEGIGQDRNKDHQENLARIRLIILTKDSPKPQTIMGHIPHLIKKLNIPIILLSGRQASLELGRVIGCRRASVCLFRSSQCVQDDAERTGIEEDCNAALNKDLALNCHAGIDSFIDYVQNV